MEEEGKQLSISVRNPLLFDHIVKRVISFVDVEFLPSCRQVSRQWEKFALPKLLENLHKFPVILSGHEDTSDDEKMERYLTYVAQKPRLIFRNFTLENLRFSAPLVDKFIMTCATEITDLKLQFNEHQINTTMIKWLGSLINLKRLTLDVDSSSPEPYRIHLGSTRTLNLKRLCFNYNGSSPLAYFHLFAVLSCCESLDELSLSGMTWMHLMHYYFPRIPPDCPNPLMEISVFWMDSGSLGYMMGLHNFKLKVLKCQRLVLWDGEGRKFSAILERHKNTLESVMVGDVKDGGLYPWDRGYEFTFPDVMPKLKVFQMGLYGPTYQTGRIDFTPVNFPVQLPSLEKLILTDGGSTDNYPTQYPKEWEYLSRFFGGSAPHTKLTELCLPFVSSKLRKSVGDVFPEIKSLRMEARLDQNLKKIWELWPQLKSLDLTLNGDREKQKKNRVEPVFTGVRKRKKQGSSKDQDSDGGLISIANLKDLKQFKLRMIGDCGGELIDFNVTRALCNSPCLEFLLFNQQDITKRGTRELLKCHPLLKKVDCPVHPEVYKIQREYLPNYFIPSEFSTGDSDSHCDCSCSFSE